MTDATPVQCARLTLGDAFRRTALRCPERTALVFNDRVWSYRALDLAVSRLATSLLDAGFRRGERIAAYGRNSDAYIILMLGCVRAGLVHVPVNFGLTGDELSYVLRQSGAVAVFHDRPGCAEIDAVLPQLSLRRVGSLGDGDHWDVLAMAA